MQRVIKVDDNDFMLIDGIAKAAHKSRGQVVHDALMIQSKIMESERLAICEGLESAENEPMTSHSDALKEFSEFRADHKRRMR